MVMNKKSNTLCGEMTEAKTKKKQCLEIREIEEEEEKNKKMKILKQCMNLDRSWSSWSDLQFDMLREIKKKISYADYIRFRGVCKNWRKIKDDKSDGELLLPWLFVPCLDWENNFSYNLFEPPLASNEYRLYRDYVTIECSHPISLGDYYNDDIYNPNEIWSAMYVDGWVYMVANGNPSHITYFLLFSVATKATFTLPQFNHPLTGPDSVFLAVSTTPDSPNCVFFALFKTNEYTRTIAIFRHGDAKWTRFKFSITPDELVVDGAVFIGGVFYFHLSTAAIGYYDLATHQLSKVDHFSTPFEFIDAYSRPTLYGLDGELMLAYYEKESFRFCIRKYDWSNQVWIPLNSLGGRSLYLTGHSLYVYSGVSSANRRIYVLDKDVLEVTMYTLEDDQLLECYETSFWGFENSYKSCAICVDPPDVLLKFGDRR